MATTQQASESVRKYEIGYLIAPTVPEGEVEEIESQLHSAITDADGDVLASETPEARDLAYTMEATTSAGEREFERGQFGWVQFSLDTQDLDGIESTVKEESDVMRVMTLQIDEEAVGSGSRDKETDEDEKDESEE